MARVFLSYDREDAERARPVALAIERAGHSVWWDRHIKGGAQYSKAIDKALKESDAVVVLWSERSVESAWVRDEAAAGRDSGRLVPITLDKTEPPLGFRQFQTIDFSGWSGRGKPPHLQSALEAIDALGTANPSFEPSNPAAEPATVDPSPTREPKRWLMIAIASGLAIIIIGLLIGRPWERRASGPLVEVTAADESPEAAALARGLFVRLGTAQAGRSDGVELVRGGDRKDADLILEVSGGPTSANLVLLRGEDRQLLLSYDFAAPAGQQAVLRTTLEVAAKSALGCATSALAAPTEPDLDLLKTYLGACTLFNSLYGSEEAYIPIPQLEQVIKREPGFTPALKQLLLAGAFMRSIPTENAKPSEQWLRSLIERARAADPDMPELGLAELELLPANNFAGRFERIEGLAAEHPEDLFILGAQAEHFMRVGRNTEAVEIAERAVRLYPLATYARSEYVRTLAFSGRSERALEELKAMEVLDEVGMNLTESKFRFNLAYGDPRSALALFRKYGTNSRNEAIMMARIEPTPANQQRALEIARSDVARRGFYAPFSEVLVAFGREDEAYETLVNLPLGRVDQFLLQTLFRPTLKPLRQDPRFLRIAQHFGLLDYWRRSGQWPDFCSEPGLPYDCKKEAAKLTA